jgi:hypothetical protein
MTLNNWELMPGQLVTLHFGSTERVARFRFRTCRLAAFEIEGRLRWFHLLSDGGLSDEILRCPWSIEGDLETKSPRRGMQACA